MSSLKDYTFKLIPLGTGPNLFNGERATLQVLYVHDNIKELESTENKEIPNSFRRKSEAKASDFVYSLNNLIARFSI